MTADRCVVSKQSVHPVLSRLRPLWAGLWVFAPIAIVQRLGRVALRPGGARRALGRARRLPVEQLDVERFRAAVVGTGVVLVFFVSASAWDTFALIGNSVGFVIALIGSLVAGSMRESRKLLAGHARPRPRRSPAAWDPSRPGVPLDRAGPGGPSRRCGSRPRGSTWPIPIRSRSTSRTCAFRQAAVAKSASPRRSRARRRSHEAAGRRGRHPMPSARGARGRAHALLMNASGRSSTAPGP